MEIEREAFRVMSCVRFFLFGWCATPEWRAQPVAVLARKMRELAPSPPQNIDVRSVHQASSIIEIALGLAQTSYSLGGVRAALQIIAKTGCPEGEYLLNVFDAGVSACGYSIVAQDDTAECEQVVRSILQWFPLLDDLLVFPKFLDTTLRQAND